MATVRLSPVFNGWQGFGVTGLPLPGGLLNTYAAGTTTPTVTYTTNAGSVQNANPIVLGSDGRPPQEIWLVEGTAYKFVLTDANAVVIGTYDNINGIGDYSGNITFTGNDTFSGTVSFTSTVSVSKNNVSNALTLTTPDSTSATWDTQPLAALRIAGPPSATTRNFLSGLWITTNGATLDKGRGILVENQGASDGICVINTGTGGSSGIAVLLQTSSTTSTGMVIGTTVADQVALVLRQETTILGTAAGNLLTVQAEGTASTEMIRVGSATKNNQVGMIFRMFGTGCQPIVVADVSANITFQLDTSGTINSWGSASFLKNQAIPAGGLTGVGYFFSSTAAFGVYFGSGAPTVTAAKGSLYCRSNGSGVNDRAYINTDGGTTWTAIVTVA